MSQRERTKRHKEKHPGSESLRKEKQRQRDKIMRFHIGRNHVSGIPIPANVDQNSEAFKRVRTEYMARVNQKVEVRYE